MQVDGEKAPHPSPMEPQFDRLSAPESPFPIRMEPQRDRLSASEPSSPIQPGFVRHLLLSRRQGLAWSPGPVFLLRREAAGQADGDEAGEEHGEGDTASFFLLPLPSEFGTIG